MAITHFNQNTTDTVSTERALGKSSTTTLVKAFRASPIHSGEYSPETVKEKAEKLLKKGAIPAAGGYYSLPGFSRDYNENGPPSAGEVKTGGEGLPGSPYGPNPSSPNNPGTINPTDVPAAATEDFPPEPHGDGSRAFPANTSKAIAMQTIGGLISGRSFEGSEAPSSS